MRIRCRRYQENQRKSAPCRNLACEMLEMTTAFHTTISIIRPYLKKDYCLECPKRKGTSLPTRVRVQGASSFMVTTFTTNVTTRQVQRKAVNEWYIFVRGFHGRLSSPLASWKAAAFLDRSQGMNMVSPQHFVCKVRKALLRYTPSKDESLLVRHKKTVLDSC